MAEERYYKHDGFERFTHWTHTLDTVILVLSGMQIHTYIFFALGKHRIAMPGVFSFVFAVFGDAVQIRIRHTTIMWLFIYFTALHVYLVVTEDRRMVKAMIDGYYYRKAGEVK